MVVAAALTHCDRIQAASREVLEPHLKRGERLPDLGLVVQLAARTLEHARDGMVTADEAHLRELSDDAWFRDARDAAAPSQTCRLRA
ncbi:MAG: hypothetical protein IPK13_14030 [Deltaproteobacteria bacterium]|nr:hypothetical protein [Deltaproteobacteria bacterium]